MVSVQIPPIMSIEEENKLLIESLRFYAERRNVEVAYLTIGDDNTIDTYEKDIDFGLNAKMTLRLLNIPYEDVVPKGYLQMEAKKREIIQREKSVSEKALEPFFFYGSLFGTIFALFLIISGFLFLGLALFIFILLVCGRYLALDRR